MFLILFGRRSEGGQSPDLFNRHSVYGQFVGVNYNFFMEV